jgi:RES domain-containing protein
LELSAHSKKTAYRLIRSRYPTIGILEAIAEPEDLEYLVALEGWTNDRIEAELGNIYFLPREQWVVGTANATIIMAAFCHPNPAGGRFNSNTLGAWYAAFELETAFSEMIFHIRKELQEVQAFTSVALREYLADFKENYVDARDDNWQDLAIYDPNSYIASQEFAKQHRDNGALGILYNSVRASGATCIVCFKPKSVINVRQARHFEIKWDFQGEAIVSQLN